MKPGDIYTQEFPLRWRITPLSFSAPKHSLPASRNQRAVLFRQTREARTHRDWSNPSRRPLPVQSNSREPRHDSILLHEGSVALSSARAYKFAMKVIIHLTKEEEKNALPLLLRHSPGMVLLNRTYVLSEDAVRALRKAGIGFSELSREALAPSLEEVLGDRV